MSCARSSTELQRPPNLISQEERVQIDLVEVYSRLSIYLCLEPCDRQYLITRLRNEGSKFATVTLPKFSKIVLQGLESGRLCPRSEMTEFSWKAGLPVFLRGFLCRLFDKQGFVLDQPDATALWVVRQLCDYCYKLCIAFDDDQLVAAEEQFVKTENEVETSISDWAFVDKVRVFIENTYSFGDIAEVFGSYRPRDTSGTFSGTRFIKTECGVGHYAYKRMSGIAGSVLNKYRSISGYFKSYPGSPRAIDKHENDTADHAEVLFVPKDSRGPRVIAREPLHVLKTQMAYFDFMVDALERQSKKRINFRDQEVNRRLAHEASIDGGLATLDLKEASDRVSYSLCLKLFRNIPSIRWFLLNARTNCAKLPSGKLVALRKLSGMGSGLTFPTMALIIHSAICVGVKEKYSRTIEEIRSAVYVYGDDVLVPREWAVIAINSLERVGLLVNQQKSFYRSRLRKPGQSTSRSCFRESCGGDYFAGVDVTPIRIKLSACTLGASVTKVYSKKRDDAAFVLQLERHCRELISVGAQDLADYYYSVIEGRVGKLPRISGSSPYLGRYQMHVPGYPVDGNYQYIPIKACIVEPRRETFHNYCPYQLLAERLRPSVRHWGEPVGLGKSGCTGDPYDVVVPRSYVIRYRTVSAFALMN